jgi:hypothetical protein
MPIPSTHEAREAAPIPQWEAPTFVEIRMDAEIGAYQTDGDEPD